MQTKHDFYAFVHMVSEGNICRWFMKYEVSDLKNWVKIIGKEQAFSYES